MWVSIWSLRKFHPNINIKVLLDKDTLQYLNSYPKLKRMIDDIVIVPTPKGYDAKQRSRQIKTKVREVVRGDYLYVDTDTVICNSLDTITTNISSETFIAAVPDAHLPLNQYILKSPINEVKRIFGEDCSDSTFWYNSGVMYVKDVPEAHRFYKRWNENWTFSCFKKCNSLDQPSLLKTDKEFGYVIKELPGIYNAQVALSLKYFADAVILHWFHMHFFKNQNYSSPYFSLQIYEEVKFAKEISPKIADLIINVKQSFATPTIPVGKEHINFLFSPEGNIFNRLYNEGGVASWLMLKVARWLEWLHKYTKKK